MKKGDRRKVNKAKNRTQRKLVHKRKTRKDTRLKRYQVIPFSALPIGSLADMLMSLLGISSQDRPSTVPESHRVNPPGTIDLIKTPEGTYE